MALSWLVLHKTLVKTHWIGIAVETEIGFNIEITLYECASCNNRTQKKHQKPTNKNSFLHNPEDLLNATTFPLHICSFSFTTTPF